MPISENQLETWSHQGSVTQSSNTYQSVKNVLENSQSPYYLRSFGPFLQGSYGNNTNVYRDSDVDIVMRLNQTFHHDAETLPVTEYQEFERGYPNSANYHLHEFKRDVYQWLSEKYSNVGIGSKAIFIPGGGSRRDCDVLVCAKFRYYYRFNSIQDQHYAEGICFFKDGTRIVNFPKQHSRNCTDKHRQTHQWFKPTVRIYKNMRNHLIDSNLLAERVAPSYYIEGMLWNVPAAHFGTSFDDTFVSTFNYIVNADRAEFRCANDIHPLLQRNSLVSWDSDNCQTFLDALRELWQN